jgi:hypothetical protein
MGEERKVYRLLVGKPKGKRPLGRLRRRWDGIRMDLGEIGGGGMEWIQLAQDRRTVVNAMINLRGLAPRSQYISHEFYLHFLGTSWKICWLCWMLIS